MPSTREKPVEGNVSFDSGFESPSEEHEVLGTAVEVKCKGDDYVTPLHIMRRRSSCSSAGSVTDFYRSSSSSGGNFKVKPLNKTTIPRERWARDSPPRRIKTIDLVKIQGDEDLEKITEKLRLQKICEGRNRKTRKSIPSHSDMRVFRVKKRRSIDSLKSSRSRNQSSQARKAKDVLDECAPANSLLSRAQPQVGWGDLISGNVAVKHDFGEGVQAVTNELKNAMESLERTVKDAKVQVEVASTPEMSNVLSTFRDFALFAIIIVLICIVKPQTKTEKICIYMLIMSVLATKVNLIEVFTQSGMFSWFKGNDVPKAQFGPHRLGDDFALMITSVINLYVCGSVGKDIFSPNEFLRVSSLLTRSTPTVSNIVRGVGLLVEYMTEGIGKYLGMKGDGLYGVEFVDAFFKEYNDLVDAYESRTLHARQTSVDRVRSAIESGEYVWHKVPRSLEYQTMSISIQNALATLRKMRTKLMSTNFLYAGVRQEPVTLLLRGKPGVGKSQSMQHFGHALCSRTLGPQDYERFLENPTSFTYSMQAENVYEDGYTQEKIVTFIDDILQARDQAGTPDSEAMKVIRKVNIFENQLHMSDIADKGNTAYRCPYVIANTNNIGDINLESIHDVGAFMRRWDVAVDVVPKIEFCYPGSVGKFDRRFDKSKFPVYTEKDVDANSPLLGKSKQHPSMCEYHVLKLDESGRKFVEQGEILEFDELVDILVDVYAIKKHYHDGYLVSLDQTLRMQREIYDRVTKAQVVSDDDSEETYYDSEDKIVAHVYRWEDENGEWNETDDEYSYMSLPLIATRDLWFRRAPQLEALYRRNPRACSWIMQCADGIHVDGILVVRVEITDFVESLMKATEHWLKHHLREEFKFSSTTYWFCGNEMFWNSLYMGVCDALSMFGYIVDFEKSMEHPFAMDTDRHYAVSQYWRILPPGATTVSYAVDRHPLPTAQVGRNFFKKRNLSTSIAQVGSNSPRFEFTKEQQTLLDHYRNTDYSKYCGLFYGVIRLCGDALATYGLEVTPEEAYNKLSERVTGNDWYKYVKEDDTVDVDLLIDGLSFVGTKRNSSFVSIPSSVSMALEDFKAKATDTGGSAYLMYKNCVRYLCSVGKVSLDNSFRSFFNSPKLASKMQLVVGGVTGLAVAITMIKSVLGVIFGNGDLFPHSDERGNRTARTRIVRRPVVKAKPHSLGQANKNLVDIMDMVLHNNMYEVWIPEEEEMRTEERTHSKAGFCIAVKGRSVIMPWHFYSVVASCVEAGTISWDDTVVFKQIINKTRACVLSVRQFIQSFVDWDEGEKRDVVLMKLPDKSFLPVRNIVDKFSTNKQLDHYTKISGVLYIPQSRVMERVCVTASQENAIIVGGGYMDDFEVSDVFSYEADTNEGDCGSPFFVNDKQKATVICGFHIAGVQPKRKGYSTRISREFLEEYLNIAKEDYVFEEHLELDLEPVLDPMGTITHLGKAGAQCRVPGRQYQTSIRESPIKDKVFRSYQKPARLGSVTIDGEKIDVMDIARKGYSPEDVYIPEEELEEASLALEDHLESVSRFQVERRLMTFEEAVLGDGPGSDFKGIPRNKSAGFPYTVMPGLKSKARFFGTGDDYDLDNLECKQLKEHVLDLVQKAENGIRCTHVFTDSLKDERRPIEKVNIGKTRMFSASPTPHLIMKRMYFGAFIKWLVANRIENNIAIGVNPYGEEWAEIARHLNKFGEIQNKGAGDYGGLDKGEIARVHWTLLEIVQRWYNDGPKNQQARKIIFYETVNSLHVNGGVFSFWMGSMPSGDFLTAPFNSLYVILMFVVCYVRMMKPWNLGAYTFFKHVYLIVLGDDNVFSVHPRLKEVFTEKLLSVEMAKLGQNYTPETKGGDFLEHLRNLEEVSFLKRNWRKHELSCRYVGPIELRVILDMINWVKKGANRIGDTEANIDIALQELSLHPREIFDKWSAKILDVVDREPGFTRPSMTKYGPLFREVCSRDGYMIETARFGPDYDGMSGKTTAIKAHCGRFSKERACLFRLTARMAREQPSQYPGTRGYATMLPRLVAQVNRGTNNTDDTFVESRVDDGPSQVTMGTTHAENDGGVIITAPKYTPIDGGLLESARTGTSLDVQSFLAKPRIIKAGSLTSNDVANTYLYDVVIPQGLFSAGDIWSNKISGSLLFRGELHVTIQLNASRFQQGRYMLCWLPTGGGSYINPFHSSHTATLLQTTQLPHVEFDLSCDTEATLVIPHVTAQGWSMMAYAGATYQGNNGMLRLYPYSPLSAVTGSLTCGYTIYAHWERVELGMPIVPQVRGGTRTRVKRRPNPVDVEQSINDIGPLESLAVSVGRVANTLNGVPLLSSVAGPVSWFSDIVAKTAASFGWSRPRDLSPAALGIRQYLYKMSNVDTLDVGVQKLALTDKNELEELPGFAGSDIDELSISHIAGIPSFWRSLDWVTGHSAGTQIVQYAIIPRSFFNTTVQAGTTIAHLTPLAFCARMFSLWRGSIVFTFKLVKTEFHSGRLLVAFRPVEAFTTAMSNPTMEQTSYLFRQIIDVRNGNEFSITIPYQSIAQYKQTAGMDRNLGTLHIFVLNPLIAPSTVSQKVTVLVEVSGGPDIEFAGPASVNGNVTAQAIAQVGRGNTCEIVNEKIGGAQDLHPSVSSRSCIGERILSFRQLLKRYNQLKKVTDMPASTDPFIQFYPWMIHAMQVDSLPSFKASDTWSDLFDEIAPCFALFRGSMRYKFLMDSADSQLWKATAPMIPESQLIGSWFESSTGIPFGILNDSAPNRMYGFFKNDISGAIEIEFPYCSQYPSAPVSELISCSASTAPVVKYSSNSNTPRNFGLLVKTGTAAGTAVVPPQPYRAIGEDASLGLFISTVPITGYDWSKF